MDWKSCIIRKREESEEEKLDGESVFAFVEL